MITPSLEVSLNTSTTPKISIYSTSGDNTDTNEEAIDSLVDTITFSTLGTTDADDSIVYELVNEDDSTDIALGTYNSGSKTVVFDLQSDLDAENYTVEDGETETYKIIITGADEFDTLSLTLPKDGVEYTSNLTPVVINLSEEIDFGSREY